MSKLTASFLPFALLLLHSACLMAFSRPRSFPPPGKSPQEYQADVANCTGLAVEQPANESALGAEATYGACMMMHGNSVVFPDGRIMSKQNFQQAPNGSQPPPPPPAVTTEALSAKNAQAQPVQPRTSDIPADAKNVEDLIEKQHAARRAAYLATMAGVGERVNRALEAARSAENNHLYEEARHDYETIVAEAGAIMMEVRRDAPAGSYDNPRLSLAQMMARDEAYSLLETLALAQRQLGVLYEKGRGVSQNFTTSALWYGKAIATMEGEKGVDLSARRRLAFLYANGLGVPRDEERARKLFDDGAGRNRVFVELMDHSTLPRSEEDVTPGLLAKLSAAKANTSQALQRPPSTQARPTASSSPVPTEVRGITYGCTNASNQNPGDTAITIDVPGKSVRMGARSGLFVCTITSTDGVVGPLSTTESCNVPLVGEMVARTQTRQSVKFDGDTVTFGGYVINPPVGVTEEERNQFNRLNMRTGLLEVWDGTRSQCHRLPRP